MSSGAKPPPSASASLVEGRRPYDTQDGALALEGRYKIEKVLGQGSMGVVLRAHDPVLDRRVALKVMRPDVFEVPGVHDAFLREAKAMARCKHPNVVRIFEFGEHRGTHYLTMEFIDGSDLESWLSTRRSRDAEALCVDEAMGFIEPLCRGVQGIHESGAVHRDLKPGNVLIGPAHRVAIADLGLSVFVDDPALSRHLSGGTPEYMAPELALRRAVPSELVHRADVYALGIMAYELLCGRLPFDAAQTAEILRMHVECELPRPCVVNPSLPPEFEAPLMAALHKDPAQRCASAEAFRASLLQALAQSQVEADRRLWDFDLLLVDDDPDMLDWLELNIEGRFPAAKIRRAGNGIEGFDALRARMPDMVISDLDMPGIDGAELCDVLRDMDGGLSVPLIVVTAVGGAPDWARLQALGANGFLVKPTDADALAALMAKLLH